MIPPLGPFLLVYHVLFLLVCPFFCPVAASRHIRAPIDC